MVISLVIKTYFIKKSINDLKYSIINIIKQNNLNIVDVFWNLWSIFNNIN
jgi:hypothetical protein